MSYIINIVWSDEGLSERARIEQLISAWQDFAYGYDLEDDANESICNILDELDINYTVEESDI